MWVEGRHLPEGGTDFKLRKINHMTFQNFVTVSLTIKVQWNLVLMNSGET